jgi:hypothetical protein
MKRTHSTAEDSKFSGNLRHYHRTGSQTQRSWDDWVDGGAVKPRGSKNRLKIIGIIAGVLALFAIIAGLIIEMS